MYINIKLLFIYPYIDTAYKYLVNSTVAEPKLETPTTQKKLFSILEDYFYFQNFWKNSWSLNPWLIPIVTVRDTSLGKKCFLLM